MFDLPTTRAGAYVERSNAGETYSCYVPAVLPPNPAITISPEHNKLIGQINRMLGRFDVFGVLGEVPDTKLFIYNYVRKEALLSSQIEGTRSSFSDLLLFESDEVPSVPLDDVKEVSNYIKALYYGLKRIREDDFPLSIRLIKEMHELLLEGNRGSNKAPGEFRKSQVWLGGSTPSKAVFVPPPFEVIDDLLANFERFIHDYFGYTSPLIKAAVAHAQFETIHPFLDGNGRLGRLLITLIFCADSFLDEPIIYLSLYFKSHREAYYEALQRVRTEEDWEGWISFFLQGMLDTAQQAFDTSVRLTELIKQDTIRVSNLGRAAQSALDVYEKAKQDIIFSVADIREHLEISLPTIRKSIDELVNLGILQEITGKGRNRIWAYQTYLQILSEGAEPLG